MGLDVCRYIEIKTNDYTGSVSNEFELNHIGNLKEDDVVMIYNSHNGYNYWQVSSIINQYTNNEEIIYIPYILKSFYDIKDIPIVYRCEYFKDLPKKQLPYFEGCIYKYYDKHNECYAILKDKKWEKLDKCPCSWKQVKWNENKNYIASGCSDYIYNYIYSTKKGLPEDICESIKNDISEYDFGLTYLYLSDLNDINNSIREDLKSFINKGLIKQQNTDIIKRLDYITEQLNIKKYSNTENINESDEDFFDMELEEKLINVELSYGEYSLISGIVELYNKYISDNNIRIIYTFNN